MPSARALVAPDKFKGTLTAEEVADAIASGLESAGLEADRCPVADGGDGTAAVLRDARGGEWVKADATDALGRPVRARFVLLADGRTAVVDVAEASGLTRIDPAELDSLAASTRGTGELIAAAIGAGAERVLLACGGSATTDGGAGALAAFDPAGVELVCLCDTSIAFLDAPRVFGPQKGGGPDEVEALENRLRALAAELPHDPTRLPFTGAAGGLAGGLWAHGARLVPGAPHVLAAIGFDARLAAAELVVTGEGRLDPTSLRGKAVGEIARRAARAGVRCCAAVGENALGAGSGFDLVIEAGTVDELRAAGASIVAGRSR